MTEPQDSPLSSGGEHPRTSDPRRQGKLSTFVEHSATPHLQGDRHPIAGYVRKTPFSVTEIQCDQMRHDQPGQKIELLDEVGSKLSAL